jgi:hypothetical protein
MEVRPQDLAVDPVDRDKHVVMVVPIDAEVDETQHVGEEHR